MLGLEMRKKKVNKGRIDRLIPIQGSLESRAKFNNEANRLTQDMFPDSFDAMYVM